MNLSDQLLLQSYIMAIEQKLEKEFIEILENELIRRGLLQQRLKEPCLDKCN
ncbi:Sporulation inhibitor sda [compost metagenome]